MILGHFRLCVLGAMLAGLAAPAFAAAPEGARPAEAQPDAGSQRADASRSRRVELPFPLDFRAPEAGPRRSASPKEAPQDRGPHPFRESLLKRAALSDSGASARRDGRLSRHPEFS
jgi:hypothetical protein